jgi:FkbM family methyltransferase
MHHTARERLKRKVRDSARTLAAAYEIVTRHRKVSSIAWRRGHLVANVRQTPGGALFVHLLDLGVGRPLYIGGSYEEEETLFLQRTLRHGMTVVDIGANIGYIATLAARSVGPTGKVLAIEPEPGNAALLAENIQRNGYQNIITCPCAVGSAAGVATLYRSSWNMGNHRVNAGQAGQAIADDAIRVELETADQLIERHGLRHVDLVKMDVEGYEPAVFSGLRQTIARDHPIILTEFWPHGMRDAGFEPSAFLAACLESGYEARTLGRPDVALRSVDHILATLPDQAPGTYTNLVLSQRGQASTAKLS